MEVITIKEEKVQDSAAYITKNVSSNYYKFGYNDTLLNDIIDIVNESPTARSCVDKLFKFTKGNGFSNSATLSQKANLNQSNNAALSDLSQIAAYSQCVTFRVLYTRDGNPARYYPIPTQNIRRQGPNTYLYNPLLGYPNRMRSDDVWMQGFNPNETPASRMLRINAQIEKYNQQWGDVVYYFRKGVGRYHDVYCVPDYYSGLNDIESDAGISTLELRNIKRGWKTNVIISTGPLDHYTEDDKGTTQYSRFERTIKKFAQEDAAVAMHLEGATNEAKPDVKVLPLNEVLDATDKSTDRVGRKVCRVMNVPPILVGFATPGQLGNNEELKNTMDLFKMTVLDRQELIKEALTLVWPNMDWSITPLSLWNAPQQV